LDSKANGIPKFKILLNEIPWPGIFLNLIIKLFFVNTKALPSYKQTLFDPKLV